MSYIIPSQPGELNRTIHGSHPVTSASQQDIIHKPHRTRLQKGGHILLQKKQNKWVQTDRVVGTILP